MGGVCTVLAVTIMSVFILSTLCDLFFVRNFSQGFQIDHMAPSSPEMFSLKPREFTFAFSVEDRTNVFQSREQML